MDRYKMAEYERLTNTLQKLSENLCDSNEECFIIGISGGSGSGKTTLAENIVKKLSQESVTILSMDSYYKVGIVFLIANATNFDYGQASERD